MTKKITVFLVVLLLFPFLSCTPKNVESTINSEIKEGKIYYSGEILDNLDVDLFVSVDKEYYFSNNMELPKKTQNAFNVSNILEDLKDENLYDELIYEFSFHTSSCGATEGYDDNKYQYYLRGSYYDKAISSMKQQFINLVINNPLRYYSNEFIADIEKLENELLQKEDIVNKYGLYYVSAYSICKKFQYKLIIDDINYRDNNSEIDKIRKLYLYGENSMSTEDYNTIKEVIKNYDVNIQFLTTSNSYTFQEYMEMVNSNGDFFGGEIKEIRDSSSLFLPSKYQKAADILQINAY